ncbi:CatB-related O-acetyltransferase [Desertivirga xinjiangensis]|uniref:CatB-related O-acetyltransferase n=1 Tax=Desertivirga xinjiangensis TaxID=539206 RepID=UPI00272E50C8|nr:CatB-related O-acetyltransferase [Pedobacter xinjiangensis]
MPFKLFMMPRHIKNLIHRSLNYLGVQIVRAPEKRETNSTIKESTVTQPLLLDPKATVQYSELRGNIYVGPNSVIHKTIMNGTVYVGKNTTINGPGTEFYSIGHPITIGSYCSIARGTAIQEHNHNWNSATSYFIKYRIFNKPYGSDVVSKGPIILGNDVWIGTQSVILTGVTIGDGAVVAANSVVTKDVPPYAIVGGTPAKVLKYRFSAEIIEKLLEVKWWEWAESKLRRNETFFDGTLTLEKIKNIVE